MNARFLVVRVATLVSSALVLAPAFGQVPQAGSALDCHGGQALPLAPSAIEDAMAAVRKITGEAKVAYDGLAANERKPRNEPKALLQEAAWKLYAQGKDREAEFLEEKIRRVLRSDQPTSVKTLGGGISVTQLVEFRDGISAVFKPEQTNYGPQLVGREIAASRMDHLLGTHFVPLTEPCTIEGLAGSCQYFLRWVSVPIDSKKPPKLFFFDQFIHNIDRHTGNYFFDSAGQVIAIDHNLAFEEDEDQFYCPYFEYTACLPSKTVYENTVRLKDQEFREQLKGFLTEVEIEKLILRKKSFLQFVEKKRAENPGQELVFSN